MWFKIRKKETAAFEVQSRGFGQISSLSISSINLITAFSFYIVLFSVSFYFFR